MEARLNQSLINDAVNYLKGKVYKTPIEYSPLLAEFLGVPVYFKLEFLQITGAFKVRGALFYISQLTDDQKANGVAACSAGNHGLGVAYAARKEGIECTIYLPKDADLSKKEKIMKMGAFVKESEFVGYDDTLHWAQEEAQKNKQHFITAFDDEKIMAGNGGSLAHEIFEEAPNIRNLIFPIGGGGLASGLCYYLRNKKPDIRLIGSQHIESPGWSLSFKQGKAITYLPSIQTIAGGLEGGVGEKCFNILKDLTLEISLITEQEIVDACKWILKNHQYIVEPSAAVALASCLSNKLSDLEGETVILLSGRNVSLETLSSRIL